MIEIAQTGQVGKTDLLFDMHRLRARVFKDMMKWEVNVTPEGLEVDQFDLPETVYLLALNDDRRVIGSWRMLPTSGPTMIRDIWPQYLESLPMPATNDVWEVSRFSVASLEEDLKEAALQNQQTIGEMFCALIELCTLMGFREIYSLYGPPVEKIIKKINCEPYKTSEKLPIDEVPYLVGAFKTDAELLEKVRLATGIRHSLLKDVELPVMLKKLSSRQ